MLAARLRVEALTRPVLKRRARPGVARLHVRAPRLTSVLWRAMRDAMSAAKPLDPEHRALGRMCASSPEEILESLVLETAMNDCSSFI